jgi:hypothetical protein
MTKSPSNNKVKPVTSFARKHCSACGSEDLQPLIDLPNFPLTGIFVSPAAAEDFPTFDQGLNRCNTCGHAQLKNTVSPEFLYQDTYTHRSSQSPISARGNDFFLNFLRSVIGNRELSCIVEIGCNDLYLLKRLEHQARSLVGFDPIWKDQPDHSVGKIDVKGRFIEEIHPENDIPARPDLVISVHTLEHVNDPLTSLRPIFERAADEACFIIEIPGFDSLVKAGRFDQIFHQHLNYFSLASANAMIEKLGGEYVAHIFNYNYWQGTMLVAFKKFSRAKRS